MIHKKLIDYRRKRRVPAQFGWVDRHLVRNGYCRECSTEALGLYLFLIAVSDCDGLSYYGDKSISREINCSEDVVSRLRKELVIAGLLAFDGTIYQILDLAEASQVSTAQAKGAHSVSEMLEKMFGGTADD